jgi:chorismate synthase
MLQMGKHKINRADIDISEIEKNPFWAPNKLAAKQFALYLDDLRKSGNSVGAIIEILASGVPSGLGAPIYAKLDTDIAAGMMSINAVKGVEIGEGMSAAMLTGVANADEIEMGPNGPEYKTNNSGGILGGISNGADIVCRFAVKPTSSIVTSRQTITTSGEATNIITKGRHDPCVGIRAVPVGEAMMACIILDHFLLHRGQLGENQGVIG